MDILNTWLDTPFEGGRHARRVEKIEPEDAPAHDRLDASIRLCSPGAALRETDPDIAALIDEETARQKRRARADRERELRVARGARGDGLAAHEQVRRGTAGQALLRRLRGRRPGRAARDRSREAVVRRRARERAAALGRAGELRRDVAVPQAGRHVPRHGSVERRAPHARLAGELLGDAVSRRLVRRDRRRADRLRRRASQGARASSRS